MRLALSSPPLLAAAACFLAIHSTAAADRTVTVQTRTGAQFSGVIDESTTASALVLLKTKDGISVRRSIPWSRLASAIVDGQPTGLNLLRAEVAGSDLRSQKSAAKTRTIELRGQAPPAGPTSESAEQQSQQQVAPALPVSTLSMYPYIANWDGDVETDGLVVEISPLDINGSLVPASGTIEVELFAAQRRTFHHAPLSGGDTLELVERWTRSLTAADFGPAGVQLRLPYGAIHPELRPDWMAGWYGLVHMKMTIPGHGVFEDSRDGVRVRPWAPNRDQLELNTGRRFLPTERLGRVN